MGANRPDIIKARRDRIRAVRLRDAERDKLRGDYQQLQERRFGKLLSEARTLNPQIASVRPENPSPQEILAARRVQEDRKAAEKAIKDQSSSANERVAELSQAVDRLNETVDRSYKSFGDSSIYDPSTPYEIQRRRVDSEISF